MRTQEQDLAEALREFTSPGALCQDFQPQCRQWVADGKCESEDESMKYECRVSCKYCDPATGHVLKERGLYY